MEAGYWQLYRFNPMLKEEGKNPFTLDSKEPTGSYHDFITGETRYRTLQKMFPRMQHLFARAEEEAKENYKVIREPPFSTKKMPNIRHSFLFRKLTPGPLPICQKNAAPAT